MEKELISILLIEDNPADVILLREALEEAKSFSLHLTVGERLEEGLTLLSEGTFEAILLDLGLPDSQGLDTFHRLHSQHLDIPIIVMSGMDDERLAIEAVQTGAQDYMVKGKVGGESIARATRYAIERQRSQAVLLASEDRFRSLFEHSPVAYQSLDSDGVYIDVNEQLCEMLGYQPGELLGRSFGDLWSSETRSTFPRKFAGFKLDGEINAEVQLVKKDGNILDAVLEGKAQFDINGQFIKSHCILHDITERVLAEQAIRESQERFGTVFRASPISIFITTSDELILDVNEAFLGMFGYKRSQVLNRTMSELNLWHDPQYRNQLIKLLGQDGAVSNHEIKYRTNGGETGDALAFVELVELAGKQCLLIMLNDVTERMQTESELRSTRKFLQGVQDSLSAHIAILDSEGIIHQVNKAWRDFGKQNGYKHPEYGIGANYLEICDSATGLYSEEAAVVAAAIRDILAGKQEHARVEYPCHSQDEKRWFLLRITSFEDQDGRWVALSHENITERKEAENAAKRAEEHFKALIENAPDGIVLVDSGGIFKYISPSARKLFGYEANENINFNPADATHPDDLQMVLTTLGDLIKDPTQIPTIQYRFKHKQGSWIWVEGTFSNLLAEPSVSAIVINFREITARIQADAALRESEKKYKALVREAPVGIFQSNPRGHYLSVNPKLAYMFGYDTPEEMISTITDIATQIHVDPSKREEFKHRLAEEGSINDFINQNYRKNGSVIWTSTDARVVKDENGKILYYEGFMTDITERAQAEERNRFQAELLDAVGQAVIATDSAGTITYLNRAAGEIYGWDLDEVIGLDIMQVTVPKISKGEAETIMAQLRAGKPWSGDFLVRRKDGTTFTAEVFNSPVLNDDGELVAIIGISNDITERKHAENTLGESEKSLRESERRLTTLMSNLPGMAYRCKNEPDWTMEFVSNGASSLTGYKPEELVGNAGISYGAVIHSEDRQMVWDGIQKALKEKQPYQMSYRIRTAGGEEKWVWEQGQGIFDANDHIVALEGFITDISERKLAEQQINELSIFNENILNYSPTGILTYKSNGECTYANEQAARIVGASVEQLKSQNFRDIESWKQSGLLILAEKASATHQIATSDIHQYSTFGKEVWMTASCVTFKSKDDEENILLTITDITERKQATQQIEQLKNFNESIIQSMTEGVVIEDERGYFTFLNPAACNLLGYESNELVGKHWSELIPPDQQLLVQTANERRARGKSDRYEVELTRKDGKHISLQVSGSPRFDAEENFIGTIAVFSDITEQARTSEALRQSEQRYRTLINQIPAIVYLDDSSTVPGQTQFVSPYIQKMLGYSPEEWISGGFDFWKERLHPDDRERVLDAYQSAIKNVSGLNCDYRIFSKDGQVVWVRDEAVALDDENGKPISVQGIIQDITEHKLSNQALRESEQRFRLLFSTSPDAILVIDPHDEKVVWPIVDCNEAACQMNGYTRDELIGLSIDILNPKPETREEHKAYLEQMKSAGVMRLEASHRHKDGRLFPIEVSTSVFTLEGRELVLGIDRDISQRKQAETEVKRRVAELETLYENGLLISGLLDPRKIAQRIVKVLEQNLNWHHIAIRQYDPYSDRLELLAFSQPNMNSAQLERQIKRLNQKIGTPDQGLSGWVIRHGKPVRSGNLPEERNYTATFPGLKSGLYVPIQTGSVAIGSIAVESEVENAFTDQDERLLITLANQAAISFENAKLYAKLQEELGERRQAEEQIRKLNIELEQRVADRTAEIRVAHQRLELATATAGIGIWEFRSETNSMYWDERMHEIYGTSPILFVPSIADWLNFIHPDDRQGMKEASAQAAKQNIPYENEYRIIAADGALRYISSHVVALFDEKDNYTGMIGVNMDVTNIKQAEEILRMANMELERALKVKDEFLANMSHELRTPLNAILGLSESLEEQIAGPLNEKQQKYIHTIGESGHHLLTLINDILDLAKIEAGQIILDINKVNISLVCQASVRMIKELAQRKEQKVEIDIDEKVNLIWADERRLKQMIVNLLSNAVKFTPQGGKLGIRVNAEKSENTVIITVWDSGIGIKDKDIERLFQPFVQLDGSLDRESQGTGLGLALVAQMTRLHGGRITVKSAPGQGSRFTITLPWKPATFTGSLNLQTGNLENKSDISTEKKQTILLVEDTDAVVMMIKDYLESARYHMIVARDGLEGITQAKQLHPDLILMDVMMPGMDGLEATRKIRNEPDIANIPIIGLTALAMPSDRERCLAAGMNGYLSKPIMLNELVAVIQSYLPPPEENQVQ